MKISFDFDSTVAEVRQQKIAAKFILEGHDVYITTSRCENPGNFSYTNEAVFKVAEKLGIPKEKVRFTNGAEKWKYLEDFQMHWDDDQVEIELIEEHTNCLGVLIFDP